MAFDIRIVHLLKGSSSDIHLWVFLAKKSWEEVRSFSPRPELSSDTPMYLPNHSLTPYPKPFPLPCSPTDTPIQTNNIYYQYLEFYDDSV